MKIPLSYQMTEYDCGPTAIINALSYLYDTEEVPPDFIKTVYQVTLDECDAGGVPYRLGTSPCALRFMGDWFNRYRERVGFPLRCTYLEKEDVAFSWDSPLVQALRGGAVVVLKCLFGCEHYVTVTGIDDTYVHVFDPYYSNLSKQKLIDELARNRIQIIKDRPKEMNRLIPIPFMDREGNDRYSPLPSDKRVALAFFKTEPWANVPFAGAFI